MNPDIMSSVNNDVITDNEVLSMANNIVLGFIQIYDMSNDGFSFGFVDQLQMIADKAKGFVYQITRDGNRHIVGDVWQSSLNA